MEDNLDDRIPPDQNTEIASNPFSFTNFVKNQQLLDDGIDTGGNHRPKTITDTQTSKQDSDHEDNEKDEEVNPFSFQGIEKAKKKQKSKSKKSSSSKVDIFSQDDDEIVQLRLTNSNLKKKLTKITSERDELILQVGKLKESLKMMRLKDAEETAALEQVTEKIEQNLQIATKRAADAETHVNELKQELLEVKADNTILRQQLHGTNSAKENVQFASQQLHKIVENAKESVKKLLNDADALNLVAEILSSYDKFEINS